MMYMKSKFQLYMYERKSGLLYMVIQGLVLGVLEDAFLYESGGGWQQEGEKKGGEKTCF